jgi:hypothetical protein
MRRLTLALGLLFVVAACGGGGSSEDGSGATTVSSPDGKAVLSFAAGSLPDGVTVDDLQVDWAEGLSDEPGAPGVVVRLAPDGLVLNQPASLRFELPDMDSNQIVITHVSEEGFEFVGGNIEDVANQRFLVTPVEHFSLFAATVIEGITTVVASADPDVVGVGQSQLVTWDVWIEPISFGMWIPVGPEAEQVQFVTIDEAELSRDPEQHWGDIDRSGTGERGANASWDPDYDYDQPVSIDDVLVSFVATANCTSVNSINPRISAGVGVTMTVTARGESVANTLFALGDALGKSDAVEQSGDSANLTGVLTFGAQLWDDVNGQFFIVDTVESKCVASAENSTTSSSTSSTTSSTLDLSGVPAGQDPRAHVTGITPVGTANSTVGLRVTFAQPWGMEPPFDLFSFFVLFNILQGDLSAIAGWEVHNEAVTPLGPGPTFLLSDGSMLIDTGFPVGPGAPIDVNGKNGSQDDATTTAVFGEFVFVVDPTEPLEPIDPNDAVWNLVTNSPVP